MSTQKTKSNVGALGLVFFITGIFLMIVAQGVDIVFGIGLLLFLISLIMGITAVMWRIAVSADRTWRKLTRDD